jgi:hypothetical protein
METTNLKRQSSISFSETGMDSVKLSVQRQVPFLTDPFPDLDSVFPVSTEIMYTKSLSHPFGTWIFQIYHNPKKKKTPKLNNS